MQIEGRAAYDLQHVGGRRLLGERLFEIARFRLHLVEQTHILDHDDSLIGERLDDFDRAPPEGPGLLLAQNEHASHLAVAQQGHADQRANPFQTQILRDLEVRIGFVVRNELHLSRHRDAAGDAVPADGARRPVARPDFFLVRVVGGFGQEYVALAQINHAVVGAEGDGGIDQRLHDFVQAERRTADDLKGVCGSRLLRERLFEVACPRLHLLKQPRVLDRDGGLVREALQQRDLLIGEGPRRLARDDDRADAPRLHQHRRIEHGHAARLPNLDLEPFRQVRLVGEIGKMHRAALRDGEAGGAARERHDVGAPVAIAPAAPRHAFRHVAIDEIDGGGLQPEQALAGFQDRLEHGRGVGDGAADDFQHIGRGRLEGERLFEVSRPRLHLLE